MCKNLQAYRFFFSDERFSLQYTFLPNCTKLTGGFMLSTLIVCLMNVSCQPFLLYHFRIKVCYESNLILFVIDKKYLSTHTYVT